ncbi:MAG: non-ribosomal peptide synthase/polyketide synthase [Anaerolineaceae bacterium]|nr:non-ribosomal peptide synthase/polyketide synthase [Anaerolineaceae bacterium]
MDLTQFTYWQQHLQNAPAMLTLATDKQRRAVTTSQTAVVTTYLSPTALATLPDDEATAVNHLLTTFALLLMRHSQQNEIVVGVPAAEQILPLRLNLGSDTRFHELAAQTAVSHTAVQANAVPLTELIAALQPAYDDSYAPFFQVVFAASPLPETEFNQLVDLTLAVQPTADGWQCRWHYRADLFTEHRIQQLSTHFETLLENIACSPDKPAVDLSIIPAAERELLLHTWNQTALDFPQDLCLHEWIGQQVQRAPERTAVSDQQTSLTYAQLEEQSGQLATYLQQQGVEPGMVVAFLLPRTAHVLVTLLGILKTGGVYLPLTTELPAERIQFILGDAQAKLVLTESDLANHLPPQIAAVELDTQAAAIRSLEPHPGLHLPQESLAYVLYTSGSTGVPKGVPISHRNIVHLLAAMLQEPGMTAEDKYLAITPFSFDILGYELYAPLLVGGHVVIASAAMLRDGHLLSERLAQGDITFMQSTPVTWQMLLAAGWEGVPHLKTISCGEALTRNLAAQIMARSAALWNLYGPTEATIFATGHRVTEADLTQATRDDLPIGRPIANMQTYILDEAHRLLPVGAVGELYLGGEGLSQGYLNRPELTEERFIPLSVNGNPSSENQTPTTDHRPPTTVYRTGDLARYRPDGVIEYLGRTDYQVKVNGLRIELGEIESRVQELDEVATAVATTWVNPANNEKQLVVYFVSNTGQTVSTNEMRQALQQTLPSYMVPSILMQLPQLPATPNGKVDRKALPAPNLDELARSKPYTAPTTTTETRLCAIWQQLLGLTSVGIHDDFLELGAHSLQATQLVTRVQAQFNVRLALRDIFEHSTVARLAELIDASQTSRDIPPIEPLDRRQPLPVSFAQQRLLVIDRLTPNEATYNEHVALRLNGRLDTTALQTAVNTLYTRHDALRTTFYEGDDGQHYQHIAAETHLSITHVDFSGEEQEAVKWLEGELARPFSLTTGPLIRVALLRLDDQQHLLLFVIHHIITDGWSMEILLDELWPLYQAAEGNRPDNQPSPLTPLPVQYADFARWQRGWLDGEKLNEQAAYWQEQLAEAPSLHNLPTDLPRPRLQSTRGTVHVAPLSAALTDSLRQLSRQENATLFMTLFAAYNLLLFRHSQQDDIVIGTASANRSHPQIEQMIGFFVNMLPLRTRIPKEASFRTFLAQVRQSTLAAQSYQDVPFERIVDVLQPVRDPSYSPVFQLAFTLENQLPSAQLGDLSITPFPVDNKTAKYDLTLFVTETNDGLTCTWEYCTDLFLPDTIARLHQHFEVLLQGIVDGPESAVTHLPLLTTAEKHTILHDWQGKVDTSIPDYSLHQQFEMWVERQPEVTAVADENETLTYQQLNQRSNQLARLLIQQGVQPGQPVAIHMFGRVPALVAITACHKARAAYVPFDPAYPTQRLQFMLADTAVPVLLTNSPVDHLDTSSCTVLEWHAIQPQLDELEATNLDLAYTPTDPAYIIYTSGSTGLPKGVVCGHTGVFNLLHSFNQWGALPPQVVGSLWTTLNFDASVYEIFTTLISGGSLHIVPQEIQPDALRYFAWLAENNIENGYMPPFMVEPFAAWLRDGRTCPSLKRLLVGVEPLAEPTLVEIEQHIPGLIIINGYGPTEATVCATLYPVFPDSPRLGQTPIGRPLLNYQVYVVDPQMQLVPVGVAGELCIGGIGLSQGYLNRPELTEERFVPNPFDKVTRRQGDKVTDHPFTPSPLHPFTPSPGHSVTLSRLYKTGDLVRYLPDGNIMFIGRSDFQLKVRGFRVELGEIENQLLAQPGVASGVVLPHTAADGQTVLVAYFQPEADHPTDAQTLRDALNSILPNYMIPSVWIRLDKMPRTPNDKIDRKALPVPNLDQLERTLPFAAPCTATEKQLLAIWQSLLSVEEISIHDNFFELGGHSLLATQLLTRIQKQLGVRLMLRDVLEHGTIARIAGLIAGTQSEADIPPIVPLDRSQPLPVSFAQQRLLVIDQLAPNQATYNVPLALRLNGRLHPIPLQQAINTLYTRHDSLRTNFAFTDDGQAYQQISAETQLSITPVDFSSLAEAAQGTAVQEWLDEEVGRPFSLTTDRLIRVSLLRLSDEQHILVIVMHHIITDGWSMDIFTQEFWHVYGALVQDEANQLPAMPLQYADFAAWQRGWLQGEMLEQQVAYWQNQLAGAPDRLNLSTDLPRPRVQSTSGTLHVAPLPAELAHALRLFSHEHSATLFMTLFAAYNVLLYRHSQQDDIVVGVPGANRSHPEIERLIGFFVNMLPLRTQLDGQESFASLLDQARQTVLEGYNHENIPFEQVVNAVNATRDTSYTPVFQVTFSLENASAPLEPLDNLAVATLPVLRHTAKFDLSLFITETNDGLLCTWEYCTDLFLPETITRLHNRFETLLESIVAEPETAVAQLPLLTAAETQTILHLSEGTVDDTIPDFCLHQQFERWSEVQPEVTAVTDEHEALTYQQLNLRANQLARLFIQQGVQPGQPVAIHLPGSVPAITAILACHKARAAYVPFDPAYPNQRLQFMLDDTAAPIILTDSPLDHLDTSRCTVLAWHDVQPQLDQLESTNLDLAYTPNDPAYIIYTSGSTGQPKGVVCGHTGVFNLLHSFDEWGTLPPGTAASLWTTLNFDVSVYEIFAPLTSGGTLHVVPGDVRTDAPRLFTWSAQQQIASLYLPPFMVEPFAAWLRDGHAYPHLRRLLVGVEPLAEATLVDIQQYIPGLVLINGYGPTEATVCATLYRVPPDSTHRGISPIGRPLHNTQIYLLDEHMQPVPLGVPGEVCIGGLGLAHGYLNRPELTAERFVPNPFDKVTRRQGDKVTDHPVTLSPGHLVTPSPGHPFTRSRLYKTGDLARFLPDGNLLFNGRSDHQVKVRGFRVELGEIEANLEAQPAVATAVVMPHTAADGQTVLVAYFTVEPGAATDQATLRDTLHQRLPNYMVPSVWVRLEEMPRTPNDKIDRKALPIPNPDQLDRTLPFATPRTATEAKLLAIWQQLLFAEEISIHDNFFELGGHSLLATQLLTRIQQQLGVKLMLRDVLEHGTIARIAGLIAQSQAKVETPPILPVVGSQPLPVSFAQQRLLVIDQLAPNQSAFNIPLALRLDGRLETAALQKTFDALYTRHDALRTSFYYGADGQPYQHVSDETHLPITMVEFSQSTQQAALDWLAEEVARPFSLTQDRLIRVSLLHLGDEQHILAIVLHHIIADGWSAEILFRELSALYTAFVAGRPSPLPPLPIQYADFAAWQRSWLQGDVLQQQIDYWQDALEGAPAVLTLPTDRPRPPVQSFVGAIYNSHIPAQQMRALKQLSHEENATLFMTLLASFQLLLACYTQQEDIVVGSPIANRHHAEIEGLIGFFVNMLVLRTQLTGSPTFRDLLSQVRQTTIGAYAHQDIPFEKLVEAKQLARDVSYTPLFQVAFTLQNAPLGQMALPGLKLSPLPLLGTTAKYDLSLDLTETADGTLTASWEYSTALFDESTVARLADHFNHLLAQIVAQPDRPVHELEILTPADVALMQQWNETERPFPTDLCLHQLISHHAAQTPDRIAIADGQTTLTYRQLEMQSNQLGHHLLALGVQPDTFVAVALDRTPHLLVGLLGILKAGGAYLPIDPAFPAQRIQFMLADAQAPLLLTQSSIVDSLPEQQAQVLCLDELLPKLADLPTDLPETAVTPHNLAYIIYTSGSTGRPKGVQIVHQSLVNLLTSMADQPGMAPDDRLLAITTLSFDIASVELYLPLLAGAQIFMAPQTAVTDPQQLITLMQQEAITYLQATPATWQMLINGGWQGQPGLKMITGGEALSVALAQQLLARGDKLWNMYAPSETTTYSTIYPVLAEELDPQQSIPIGRPLANTQLYILDHNRRPVPIGVTGELYIGGTGVARGYLNQPELTSERFVENPFDKVTRRQGDKVTDFTPSPRDVLIAHPVTLSPGHRVTGSPLYRTGDLASFRPDGAVNFYGRSDHQVKIRGFRVELGEIESRLRQHPGVAQAVVHPFKQQLVAYLIFEREDVPTAELRAFVQETLPAYMVPHLFIGLDAFPLTPNGKVDRKTLPAPTGERDASEAYVAPSSPTERQLAEIWQRLLNVNEVGIHDNFFTQGGHSLLAIQLISAVGQQLDRHIPLRVLFDAPTIAGLAHYLDTETEAAPAGERSSKPAVTRAFPDDRLPLSLAQKRLWFFYKLNPQSAAYNVPIALRLRGDVNLRWLQQSLLDVINRHEVLRTVFYEADDVYGRSRPIKQLPVQHTDLRQLPADQVEAEVMQRVADEVKRPFALTTDLPIRVQLLDLADDAVVLLLTLHHIAIDLWSIDLLVHEVVTIYRAYQAGEAPDLPPLAMQYSDYAAWQNRWLAQHQDQQQSYWQQTLAANLQPLALPTDKPRPAKQTDAGADYAFDLPEALSRETQHFVQQEKATLYMVLLAAYHALLYRYTQQTEINVGSPIANRHHAHTENLIGFFVNTVVINASLTPEMSFRQLVHQVRQRTLGAQENQDIPFNKVVEAIEHRRDAAHSPLFQTLFTAQAASPPPGIPGIKLEPIPFGAQTAKFDITLSLTTQNERIFGGVEYNTDLFSAARIKQLCQHYVTLLDQMLAQPDIPIAQLDLRTAAERDRQAQATQAVAPAASLTKRFATIAAQFGEKTAVHTPTTTLTYNQLHRQSNQVAHLLRQQGVQPGETVAIYASPTPQMITAVWGVLKAGGIYLPLNEDEPRSWQQQALQDGSAKLLLYCDSAPPADQFDLPALAIETAAHHPDTDLPAPAAGGLHLPFLGSYPAAELAELADIYPIEATSRVLHFAVFASHQAAHELFATLLNGATLYLAPRSQLTKLTSLYDLLAHTQVDFAILPAVLLGALDPAKVPHLQTAVSLEADMPPALWQKWHGRRRLHGALTTATLLPVMLNPVDEPVDWLTGTPTAPVAIRNSAGQPAPIGVIGELHVGANLLPTDDKWRWVENGRLQFRRYHPAHTTTRSHFVDTTAVAAHLARHPAVQDCIILPDDAPCEKRQLHAYVVTRQPLETAQLEQLAKQQLPAQFVPAVFHVLEEMPVTAVGEIDYPALQALQQTEQTSQETDSRAAKQAELAARRDNLSAKKQALLARWQRQKVAEDEETPRIPPRPADQPLPLSFAQQRMWFIAQINPEANASYNIPIHLEIRGVLDTDALAHSFNKVLQRHESLRTHFVPGEDETPYQEVAPFTAVPLPCTDLSELPDDGKAAQADAIRRESALTPFDLQTGPIYRIHLLQLASEMHLLLFTVHHIAFDAWSTGLFLREIVVHYLQKTTGRALPLPSINVQYGDYTVWQQARLTDDVMAKSLAFWREHLAQAPTTLALPTDKPRPQWQTSHGDMLDFTLPLPPAEKVKQWTQAEQATLFVTLLTAFNGLLYRYTNQEDLVVGTPIANRSHPDLKNMIGFFLNTLALRSHVDETTTWRDLLQQTRQTMLAAHAHQEYPFENLVQALLPHRDPGRHPLFQVMFVLQNQGDDQPLPAGLPLRINAIETATKTAKFDLLLHVQETAAEFLAAFEYNTDLFYPETIARMAQHFQQVVTAMVDNPDQPIIEAQLLTPEEEAQIEAWNDTAVPIDPHELVHHRFEQQADATPEAVAVLFGDQQLTYAQLDARANQLAHFLQANGVQPNDPVGIMIPRSLEMVTAVLAILKAGAGYVPLDPDYPPDRLQLMLDHADVRLLLTHSSLDLSDVGCSRINVNELDLSPFAEGRVTAVIDPEHSVYVIFTSGSTGTPKGVVLPHRALNNMLAWQKKAMFRQGPTRTLQFTSLSFDVHFQEMFSTWQAGGTLVLIPDDVRRDGEQLLATLQKYRIERLFLPFVALHNLAEAAHWLDSYPDTLQEVITAGEALQSTPPIRDFFKKLPGCAFHNHYGPSESHVITAYTLVPDPDQWPDLPPIGRVIDNNKIYLLDRHMRPVPIGIPGELYIDGLNLATGYINQPDLTAERFVPNPFDKVTGRQGDKVTNALVTRSPGHPAMSSSHTRSLLYKTGDLARYLPDGNIQYLGRNDFQVKIRGHRVELGEIETVLNQHPAVQQAVVQAHKPDQGAQQLVAYVITVDETAVTTLPALLREKLPAYMVPAHFIRLEQFPLTPSGKINRRALPAPENVEMMRLTPYVAPETPLQKQLVEVWERVLNVSPVGIHDNFFELGGHSLLAIRLVAAMQKATAVKLPLPRLFQEGTIAAIARYMSDPTTQTAHSPLVTLRPGRSDQPPLIVIHPGSGQVLPYLGLVQALPAQQPVYGLQSLGLLPHTPAQTDIASMAASYLQALEATDIGRPYHLLGWSMGGVVALEMAQQLAAADQAVGSLTLIDTFAPSGQVELPPATTLLQWFAQDTGYLSPKTKLNLLPDGASIDAQLRHLWPQLQAAGHLPEELTWDEFARQFTVFQANYAAMQAYGPRPFAHPVQLIVAKNSARRQKDKWLGWQAYLAQLSVEVLRGNHFTLLQAPKTVKQIAQTLTNRLVQPAGMR